AATTGYLEQHLSVKRQEKKINDFFESKGTIFLALDNRRLVGFIFAKALDLKILLPEKIKLNYSLERSFYIWDLHISKEYRSRGIGTMLLNAVIKDIDKALFDYLFISAWEGNVPASNLYKKNGFAFCAALRQEKIKKDKRGKFIVTRQFMVKSLKNT
ncbi:MAG: GNAT family N-acetyltransferase, partial [Candidatus Diapherotrites archaeon]|nr:GNAT family N-acetyltransferase [Candidatus Diapherotrites archaeon]